MSDDKTDMDAFLARVTSVRPSALLTPEKNVEELRGSTPGSDEDQMMANLSLTSAPKEKRGSKITPSVYGEYSKTAKKYSLFITPSSQEELDRYCFSAVGYGSTVCLKKGV